MKRARRDVLTGGTGDVSPQWLKSIAVQSGNDTTTTSTVTLPVTRIPQSGVATIIEVLRVKWIPAIGDVFPTAAANTAKSMSCTISTKNFGTTAPGLSEGSIIDNYSAELAGAFTAAGTYGVYASGTEEHDLSDGAGHGLLIATDQMFFQIASANTGVAVAAAVWLLYRFKSVSIEEYVGIVQSQQT